MSLNHVACLIHAADIIQLHARVRITMEMAVASNKLQILVAVFATAQPDW